MVAGQWLQGFSSLRYKVKKRGFMEDQELLRSLLNGPCSHFKKFGQDDYRDPAEKNPSGSLSSKGFYDHRINQSIPLRSYAKDEGISMFDKNSNKVEKIWEESELINN